MDGIPAILCDIVVDYISRGIVLKFQIKTLIPYHWDILDVING